MIIDSLCRLPRAGANFRRGLGPRRLSALGAGLAAASLWLAPGIARADTSSTLTVVGTSDVSDSGLIPNLIQPLFEAAYPQFQFKYIGTASGTAITDAETGAVGASALIVHAASLENQFVAGGYSYDNDYGRALWTNDFVFAGPAGDPAGVHANAATNIAQAFADVAVAGIAHKAEFVSRGGTPGTTVAEHQIWALVNSSDLRPGGLTLCAVSAANGGGDTPISSSAHVANGAPCPNGGALPSGSQLPSWYAVTGLTQGPNVQNANACTGYPSGPASCYVFTDEGTYDYLQSGTDPAGSIPNLTILTQHDNSAAPGGQDELVNYFHGYIVNPSSPGETVNLPAAQDFLNFITSPTVQAKLATYLATAAGGAPFTADASPIITSSRLPTHVTGSRPVTITGQVTNAEPGYPPLHGIVVTLNRVKGTVSVPVASARTDITGAFTLRTTLPASGSYTLSTPQYSQIENNQLSPVFGDTLSPAVTAATRISVTGVLSDLTARSLAGGALVTGAVSPSTGHVKGTVTIYGRKAGSRAYRKITATRLGSSDGRFATVVVLTPGRWTLRSVFSDRGTLSPSRARTTSVTVLAPSRTDRIRGAGVRVGRGHLTAHVKLTPKAASGATVSLYVVQLSATGAPVLVRLDTVSLRAGVTTATLHGRLKGTGHWAVLEAYAVPGQPTAWTSAGQVTVRAKKS